MEFMGAYDEIIELARPEPSRPRMSLYKRAAQFMAFTPLEGYEERVCEAMRETQERLALSYNEQETLARKLDFAIVNDLSVNIVYFVADRRKSGGEYRSVDGRVKCIDHYSKTLVLVNGKAIRLTDIYDIQSEVVDYAFGA